jgi:ribosome-associated protein
MKTPIPTLPPGAAPDPDDTPTGPSKSQRKRDMHALQDLGERLVGMPPSRFEKLALPEELVDAVALARRITSHEGLRRQMQYVGKLMRRVDAEMIRSALDMDDAQHHRETAVMHAAERWRDALLESPERLAEFNERYPAAVRRGLHAMIRSARAETARQQHGRHYRELYRELRDILLADLAPPPATTGDADA